MAVAVALGTALAGAGLAGAQEAQTPPAPRARDLGIPFPGEPGAYNAITDVPGVRVGHATIIRGEGRLVVGEGPVRTGVTAVIPRTGSSRPVFAGWYSLNGNGEMTGTTWVEESGLLDGPVMITNTHSVGAVHEAVIDWSQQQESPSLWSLPVVGETWDGRLNDINGFHVRKEHVFEALGSASSGPVTEGSVGGGTGMVCNSFKGGIGTASRRLGPYTLGVLVQCNYGRRGNLFIAGVPVGQELLEWQPDGGDTEEEASNGVGSWTEEALGVGSEGRPRRMPGGGGTGTEDEVLGGAGGERGEAALDGLGGELEEIPEGAGSIIVVIATDAPLLPYQLRRLARRAPIGIARMGGYGMNSSGDIFIAFSTANPEAGGREQVKSVEMLANYVMDPLMLATAEATEEAITNAMVAGRTMVGRDRNMVPGLPHDEVRRILGAYNRLAR